MDELLRQGQWWWLLVPIAAAVVGTVAGVWIGARLSKTTEHEQWLRNQKIDSYTNFLRQIHAWIRALDKEHDAPMAADEESVPLKDITDTTNARLDLVASRKVRGLIVRLEGERWRCREAVSKSEYITNRYALNLALERLLEAMRSDLDSVDRDSIWRRVFFRCYQWFVRPVKEWLGARQDRPNAG
ncbi:hypothetical protein [Paenarthrobacter nitroguajacolicus]|uniref:hypothetical protein n=1 Tax=Paenarthrobacter nitroguajacolicus TaxID=211146 RepID=UPI00285EE807|nr:hypothetical protein [Paenarthrobacter nitroguajacolicus]MDR6637517.1 hypothetical protein [Paenarthrobacter nitroguajacolicus]